MTENTWAPSEKRSLASLADAVAFDLKNAGLFAGATKSFAESLRRAAEHDEEVSRRG